MTTINQKSIKKSYFAPQVVCVKLDNEISLILTSAPPEGPDEGFNSPRDINNNPLKCNLA